MPKSAGFKWTKNKEKAASALADGLTQYEAAEEARVSERTIRNWLTVPEFAERVNQLTMITGIAMVAERIRIAKRIVRQAGTYTEKDLLDWLKYVQAETEALGITGDISEQNDWWEALDDE